MTAFIRQEAVEKAREIQLKADEEFAIEKSKLVRQETAAVDALYAKKFKQAAMSQQITRSTLANKTRLKVLSARQALLDELFERARERLAKQGEESAKKGGKKGGSEGYQETLTGLVLEGMYALNESKIVVRARKQDNDVVKKALKEAEKKFKEVVGRDVSVEIDESEPLPEGSYVHLLITFVLKMRYANLPFQYRRSLHPRVRRQDRDQQHLRRTSPATRNRRAPRRARAALW